jgi:3-deoxy-D-manno-octulosonic acid kinase
VSLPPGFVAFSVGRTDVVCAEYVADAVRVALAAGTLYRYAETHPTVRPLAGRGIAYAATLPGDVERVVVRHNRHGGLLAPLTRDVFQRPTRAPYELETSERLRRAGVPTPTMLGYTLYPAAPGFCRVDVMSREVADSFDLSAVVVDSTRAPRDEAWRATALLVNALNEVGARHRDLNVKNVLLRHAPRGGLEAMVLDVDRVEFAPIGDAVAEGNVSRLLRSAKKWQTEWGAAITDAEIAELAEMLRAPQVAPSTAS